MPHCSRISSNSSRSSARSMSRSEVPRIRHAHLGQRLGQLDGGLPAELHHCAVRLSKSTMLPTSSRVSGSK